MSWIDVAKHEIPIYDARYGGHFELELAFLSKFGRKPSNVDHTYVHATYDFKDKCFYEDESKLPIDDHDIVSWFDCFPPDINLLSLSQFAFTDSNGITRTHIWYFVGNRYYVDTIFSDPNIDRITHIQTPNRKKAKDIFDTICKESRKAIII